MRVEGFWKLFQEPFVPIALALAGSYPQVSHSDEVVGCQGQGEHPAHLAQPSILGLAHARSGRYPPKYLLRTLSHPLTNTNSL